MKHIICLPISGYAEISRLIHSVPRKPRLCLPYMKMREFFPFLCIALNSTWYWYVMELNTFLFGACSANANTNAHTHTHTLSHPSKSIITVKPSNVITFQTVHRKRWQKNTRNNNRKTKYMVFVAIKATINELLV